MDCCVLPSRIHRQIWLRLGTIHLTLVRCPSLQSFLAKIPVCGSNHSAAYLPNLFTAGGTFYNSKAHVRSSAQAHGLSAIG